MNKKAGKNSPAPTSSGKESSKEEVKTSAHRKEEENVMIESNEEKIKELQTSVASFGTQLKQFQSEWQTTAAITMEVRDLLQGFKKSSQENLATPISSKREDLNASDEDEQGQRFLQDAHAAKKKRQEDNLGRMKFSVRKDDSRSEGLKN